MYPVSAFAYTPSPTMPPAQVASVIAPSAAPALGRLPASVVGASVPYSELQNNTRGAPSFPSAPEAPEAAISAVPESRGASAQTRNTLISGFPSLFLAQLLGQNSGAAAQSLAISYETMLDFSTVKYKPSDASLPKPSSPLMEFLKTVGEETPPALTAAAPAANRRTAGPEKPAARVMENTAAAASEPDTETPETPAAAASSYRPAALPVSAMAAYGAALARREALIANTPEEATA